MPHFSSELYDAAVAGNAGAVQRYIVDQPDAVDAGCEQASLSFAAQCKARNSNYKCVD